MAMPQPRSLPASCWLCPLDSWLSLLHGMEEDSGSCYSSLLSSCKQPCQACLPSLADTLGMEIFSILTLTVHNPPSRHYLTFQKLSPKNVAVSFPSRLSDVDSAPQPLQQPPPSHQENTFYFVSLTPV